MSDFAGFTVSCISLHVAPEGWKPTDGDVKMQKQGDPNLVVYFWDYQLDPVDGGINIWRMDTKRRVYDLSDNISLPSN